MSRSNMTKLKLCWTSPVMATAILAWPLQANAQTTPPAAGSNVQTATAATGNTAVNDIIVTANRRDQRLQDVPVAISAISGELADAKGVSGTASLQTTVPSLNLTRQTNGPNPFLRGVGTSNGDPNTEGSVAIYVDGVYMPSPFGNFFDFSSVDHVEVLKGPQGTLFGRNATGGVIHVLTKDPSQKTDAAFTVGYANYETVKATGYLSGAITSNLSANLAVLYQNQDKGFGRNIFTGERTLGSTDYDFRAKLLWSPTDRTDIKLAGDYSRSENGGMNVQVIPGARNILGQGFPGKFNTNGDVTDKALARRRGASLRIDHDFDVAKLMSLSAYRKTTGYWQSNLDLSPVPLLSGKFNQAGEMYSQEVHLLAPSSSRFQWFLGAFFFDYKAGHVPGDVRGLAFAPLPGVSFDETTHTRSVAVFAQGTYPIGEETNLTVGLRNTWDRVRSVSVLRIVDTDIVLDPITGEPRRQTLKYSKPTWRLSVDHKFGPDTLGYLSYNRGVKSGNFNVTAPPSSNDPYLPEKLDAYEAGVKTEFFDRSVKVNLSAFYYKFANIQFQRVISGSALVFNGPSAKSYGGEIELEVRASPNLSIQGGLGIIRSKIGDFPNAPNVCRLTATGTNDLLSGVCDPVTGAVNPAIPYNARGNQLPQAPKFTGNIGVSHTLPTTIGNFDTNINVYYNSGFFSEIDNRLRFKKYALLNGSLRWTDNSDQLSVTVWGKNLANTYYYAQLTSQAGLSDFGSPAAPRTFGVTLGYKYK